MWYELIVFFMQHKVLVYLAAIAIACENLDRDYICFEKDAEICRKANERLNKRLHSI